MVASSEKRDFQRMVVDNPVEYQLPGEQQIHHGVAKNLSSKGMMFIARDPLAPGSQLRIKLTPASSITPPMQAQLQVLRCQPQDDGDYRVACKIISID